MILSFCIQNRCLLTPPNIFQSSRLNRFEQNFSKNISVKLWSVGHNLLILYKKVSRPRGNCDLNNVRERNIDGGVNKHLFSLYISSEDIGCITSMNHKYLAGLLENPRVSIN